MLLHPHFIFDGSEHPWFKPDKEPISAPSLLVQRFQELLTAFGFNWHIAPAEAEAELAYFYSHGLIDAVVTPFSDVLLFGATSVIQSIPSPSEYGDVKVYTSDALQHGPFLEWGDLLLMALMNGAGYDILGNIDGQALQNCLQVMNYCDGPLLLYEISLPHQHLPAAPTDINDTHVRLSGEESDSTSLDMKVPALVLELSRPDLVQGPTSSPTSQSISEGEDGGDMVIDLTFDTAYFDTGVIDLMGED
ncbi:PIN domain-like protein [Scleroderma citrinum]